MAKTWPCLPSTCEDAQGRVVPITDNVVTFKVTGAGKLIGVGNGDPTDQEPDKGTSRKAFSGYCMAIVQSSKTAGDITVEATSPGLASASVTLRAKAWPSARRCRSGSARCRKVPASRVCGGLCPVVKQQD